MGVIDFIFTFKLLSVRLIFWLYFLLSWILGFMVFLYWKREEVKRLYYTLRYAERVIKVIIHFKAGLYKVYWRLIPDRKFFELDKKIYHFDNKNVLKENEFFSTSNKGKEVIKVDGKQYDLNKELYIKRKGSKYPEIHYLYNIPHPIDFNLETKEAIFSSTQLQDFKENDLFAKLLTLQGERGIIMFLLILGIGNLLATMFIIAKMMGWID